MRRPVDCVCPRVKGKLHMSEKYTGGCACGALKFEFGKDPEFIPNCHCRKKASGGEVTMFFGVPEDDFPQFENMPS